MFESFGKLALMDQIFVTCAIVGAVMLAIRMALQFIGGDSDADVGDADAGGMDADMDMDALDGDVGDADVSFTLFSFQSLSAFFLMFGLVGFGLHDTAKLNAALAVAGGTAAGLAMVWVLTKLMSAMMRLQSSGTLNVRNAIGSEGEVYLTIHADGIGKVQVVIQGRLKVLNAKASDDETIKTGARVKVVSIVSGNMLVVEELE
jgi:hypothetical protein